MEVEEPLASAAAFEPDERMAYRCSLRIPMRSVEHARVAAAALNVDEELQPQKVLRVIDVDGAALRIRIATIYPRLLRLSVKGILDFTAVAVESLQEFGGEPSA